MMQYKNYQDPKKKKKKKASSCYVCMQETHQQKLLHSLESGFDAIFSISKIWGKVHAATHLFKNFAQMSFLVFHHSFQVLILHVDLPGDSWPFSAPFHSSSYVWISQVR